MDENLLTTKDSTKHPKQVCELDLDIERLATECKSIINSMDLDVDDDMIDSFVKGFFVRLINNVFNSLLINNNRRSE